MRQPIYCISPEVIADAADEAEKDGLDIGEWSASALYKQLMSKCWNPSAVNLLSVINILNDCRIGGTEKGCDSGFDLIARRIKEKRFTL